jgi:hypothetical protein
MAKYFFCIFCGNSVGIKSTRCSKCSKNLEEVLELVSLLETSTLTNREVVEKKGKFKIKEIWEINNLSNGKNNDFERELSTSKFFIFLSITIALVWFIFPKFTGSTSSSKVEDKVAESVNKKSFLNSPVKDFVTPSSRNLMRINGLDIVSEDGNFLTVKEFSDNWYEILNNRLKAKGQSITGENLSISFQPGGALYNALNQYFINNRIIKVIIEYMIDRASS